jgi:hypothetical protein
MSVFVNREGNISIFRVGLGIGMLGIIFVVGGLVLFTVEQAQRKSPFHVEVFPSAVEWYTEEFRGNSRRIVYQIEDTPAQEIAIFYQQRLDQHYNNRPGDPRREQCVRTPVQGNYPDYVPGTGIVPYIYRCEFDNSTFNANQSTTVTIQPGVRNDTESTDYEGLTFIIYDQIWSR